MITAKHPTPAFEAMPDDAYTAMRARGRKYMDRAFKAVKGLGLTLGHDLKRFVVFITAPITSGHQSLLVEAGSTR